MLTDAWRVVKKKQTACRLTGSSIDNGGAVYKCSASSRFGLFGLLLVPRVITNQRRAVQRRGSDERILLYSTTKTTSVMHPCTCLEYDEPTKCTRAQFYSIPGRARQIFRATHARAPLRIQQNFTQARTHKHNTPKVNGKYFQVQELTRILFLVGW